jgi:formate hydrogenlyase transcriptional activator
MENLIERSVILSQGPTLKVSLSELKPLIKRDELPATTLEDIEREHIRRTLEECNWVVSGPHGAAVKLGMKRTSPQYKMHKLGLAQPH